MNGAVAAAHGKVAATIVHLAGDPSLNWAAFAAFAHEQGNPEVAALAESLDSFTQWARQLHTEVIEANGRLDTDPSEPVAEPETVGWCPASKTVSAVEGDARRIACPQCGRDVGVSKSSRIIATHKLPARPGT